MAIDVSCSHADEKTGGVSEAPDTQLTMRDAASCAEKNCLNFEVVAREAMACACDNAACAELVDFDTHVVTDTVLDKAMCQSCKPKICATDCCQCMQGSFAVFMLVDSVDSTDVLEEDDESACEKATDSLFTIEEEVSAQMDSTGYDPHAPMNVMIGSANATHCCKNGGHGTTKFKTEELDDQ